MCRCYTNCARWQGMDYRCGQWTVAPALHSIITFRACLCAVALCIRQNAKQPGLLNAITPPPFNFLCCRLIKVADVQNSGQQGVLAARVLEEVHAALQAVQQRIGGSRANDVAN